MTINLQHIPNDLFKQVVDGLPICTVDILLFNRERDKILLCRRNNEPLKGVFLTNGGRLFKNEELDDCAVRQAKIELGINIDKNKLIFGGVTNWINETSIFENINYHVVDIFFGYIIDESIEIKLDKQHETCKWFPINDIGLHPFVRKNIDILISKLTDE